MCPIYCVLLASRERQRLSSASVLGGTSNPENLA